MSELIIAALATHRLTRLVTQDTITRPLRVRIIRWAYHKPADGTHYPVEWTEAEWDQAPHDDDDAPKLAAFIVCPWCVSAYASIIVVCMRRRFPQAWSPIATALALSSATGLLARLEA